MYDHISREIGLALDLFESKTDIDGHHYVQAITRERIGRQALTLALGKMHCLDCGNPASLQITLNGIEVGCGVCDVAWAVLRNVSEKDKEGASPPAENG